MISLLVTFITSAHAAPVVFFDDLQNFKSKNLNLQTEHLRLEASSDFLLSKKLFWTPRIDVSLQKTQTRLNSEEITNSDSINADLNLNLFRGGSDWNLYKDAKAQNNAQELQVLNESLRVEIKASDLIFKSLYLIESKRIEEQLLKLKEESLKIVTDRYRQGKLPLQEVTKSEVDLIQQKNKLRSANLDYIENKSQISSLFINEIKTSAWPFDESSRTALPESSNLPLIEQQYWLGQSRHEAWKAARGEYFPSLDLQIQHQESPVKNRKDKQWTGLLVLSFPLWSGLETYSKVSSAYADYVGALNTYKDTEQSLREKNKFLKQKIEIVRLNLSESKKNLETSKKLYQDILRSFRLGRISTNDLILEQNRLLESENALALSQLNFHQSLIETCALAGLKSSDCVQ
ncbi:MAG: TolC family protein [Bacteriovorax sp.]